MLNRVTDCFQKLEGPTTIPVHSVNGVFQIIQTMDGNNLITYKATSMKKISRRKYLMQGAFRLRYRLVDGRHTTLTDGILWFPLHKTFENQNGVYTIPNNFNDSTAVIFGIDSGSHSHESKVGLRIFANGCGNTDFYEATIKFDTFLDRSTIIGHQLKYLQRNANHDEFSGWKSCGNEELLS